MDLSALTNSSLAGSSILNTNRSSTGSSNLQGSDFQSMLSSMLSSSGLSGASSSNSLFGAASSDSSTTMLMLPLMFAMMEQLLTKQMELLQAGKIAPAAQSTDPNPATTGLDTAQSSAASNLQSAATGQQQAKELKQPAILLANQARAQALAQTAAQKQSYTPPTTTPISTSPESSPVSAAPSSGHAAPYGEPAQGPLTQKYHSGHNGLDIGVVVGTPIHTTMDGKVIYAGWSPIGYGNLVIVQNGDYQTYYAHLSKIPVTNGQTVQAGSVIGLSGSTGNSTGPHLHYEIRYKGKNLDPTSLTLNKAI